MASFDRSIWLESYDRHALPKFPCPRCKRGSLIADVCKLQVVEPQFSKSIHKDSGWDPEWESERFSLIFMCDEAPCGEICFAIGDTVVEESLPEVDRYSYSRRLRPRAFSPSLCMFRIPEPVPYRISLEIKKSFALYWTDLNAAANRLRASVEKTLKHQESLAETQQLRSLSKPKNLITLIKQFGTDNAEDSEALNALRMIGSLGSNGSEVHREPLLNAYEKYEASLVELYGKRNKQLRDIRT